MGAVIAISQPEGAGPGLEGLARNDIWLDQKVLLTAVGSENFTYQWAFLSIPRGSKAKIVGEEDVVASFVPDVVGTYRVQLITNGGGAGNVQVKVIRCRYDNTGKNLANRGWAYPGIGEQDEESNYPIEEGVNVRGWSEVVETIFEDIRKNAFDKGEPVNVLSDDILSVLDVRAINFVGSGFVVQSDPSQPNQANIISTAESSRLTDVIFVHASVEGINVGVPVALTFGPEGLVIAGSVAGQPHLVYGLVLSEKMEVGSMLRTVTVVTAGLCPYPPGGLVAGQELFLGPTGTISPTPPDPSIPGRAIVSLGIARSANTILVRIRHIATT